MGNFGLSQLLLSLALLLLVFVVGRELVTWYWKINRIVDLLESIDQRLAGATPIAASATVPPSSPPPSEPSANLWR